MNDPSTAKLQTERVRGLSRERSGDCPGRVVSDPQIVWRNRNTSAVLYEYVVCAGGEQWVKIREVLTNGVRERELVGFKAR